jgi:hypothetical protein
MPHGRCAIAAVQVRVAYRAFHYPPAVISTKRNNVDLFSGPLAHVAGPKLVRAAAVERPSKRISQADRVDLVSARNPNVRVVRRDRVSRCRRDRVKAGRDPEKLSKQVVYVLSPIVRIVGPAAIAWGDVKIVHAAVVAKLYHPAVMVREGVRYGQNDPFRVGVAECVVVDSRKSRNCKGPVRLARIKDKKVIVVGKIRMKCQAKQAAFAAGKNTGGNVQKIRRRAAAKRHDLYYSALLDNE